MAYPKGRKRGPRTPEHTARLLESRRNNGRPWRSEEAIAKGIETRRENGTLAHTEEQKKKIGLANSEKMKKAWAEGRVTNSRRPHKKSGGVHNGVWMRCLNSEGVFARELDRVGIEWIYEPRRFKTSRGTYLPDFFLPEFNIYVDVKGSRVRALNLSKIEAFREELGKCLVIVYQSELPSLHYSGR